MSIFPGAQRVPSWTLGLRTTPTSSSSVVDFLHTRAQGSFNPSSSPSILHNRFPVISSSSSISSLSLSPSTTSPSLPYLHSLAWFSLWRLNWLVFLCISSRSPSISGGFSVGLTCRTASQVWNSLWYGIVSYSEHCIARKSGSPSAHGFKLHSRYLRNTEEIIYVTDEQYSELIEYYEVNV